MASDPVDFELKIERSDNVDFEKINEKYKKLEEIVDKRLREIKTRRKNK